MRFLMNVVDGTAQLASPDEMRLIDEFNDALRANGHWVFACGIHSPESSVVFDNRAGRGIVSVGPFLEGDEWVSGFWIIEADSIDTAQRLAAEGSRACNRKVELRQLHG